MRFLFIHQNLPGQFTHQMRALLEAGHEVIGIAEKETLARCAQMHPGVKLLGYTAQPPKDASQIHPYLRDADTQVRRGQQVVRCLLELKKKGLVPELIVAHPGWGESLFVREVFPQVPLINYLEFFFSARGGDVNFDPEFPATLDTECRLTVRNSLYLSSVETCTAGVAPTPWQRSRFPARYQEKIAVLHEGVDTDAIRPDPHASWQWQGRSYQKGQPIVTYVARGLEPYRGFHIFMRLLPRLLRQQPQARVIVVGGDAVSYGQKHPSGRSWREALLDEARAGRPGEPGLSEEELARVHFTGKLPHGDLHRVFQVSSAHLYLTYPFVLSWSMLEAMSCGALVIGSRTAPVEDVLVDGGNGLLVDFFDTDALLQRLHEALAEPARFDAIRQAARETVVNRFDLKRVCLPAGLQFLLRVAGQAA
jgi:glycosyltransferase involved in cell wall biosynthesis